MASLVEMLSCDTETLLNDQMLQIPVYLKETQPKGADTKSISQRLIPVKSIRKNKQTFPQWI